MKVFELVYFERSGNHTEINTEIFKDVKTARERMRRLGETTKFNVLPVWENVSVKMTDDYYGIKGSKKKYVEISVSEKEVKENGSYIVRVPVKSYVDVQVDAATEDEAKKIACNSGLWDEEQVLRNCEMGGNPEPVRTRKVEVVWDVDDEDELDDLPEVVDVPADIDEDSITDWLSDNYGYCVEDWGFME